MGTVFSVLSLLMALAIAGALMALSRRGTAGTHATGGRRTTAAGGSVNARGYTTMGYAFTWTLGAAVFLVSGLIGFHLNARERFGGGSRWSDDYIWEQIWIGLAMACAAVWFWRKGLREIRSNVYVPELAGHDATAPPSRRIERR